jgi:ferredoxin
MDYKKELTDSVRVSQAVSCMIECLEHLDTEYEPLQEIVRDLAEGRGFSLKTLCRDSRQGETCKIEVKKSVGGLYYALKRLQEVIDKLQLEVMFDGDKPEI